jgi:hypothetical protein
MGVAAMVAAMMVVTLSNDLPAQLGWSGSIDASGTILFGNASERVLATRLQLGRADSTVEVRGDSRLRYSDAPADSGGRRVSGRAWLVSLALDYLPFARYSPFAFGSVESNLQLRLTRRASAGAGAKRTFVNRDDAEASVSLALLGERTRARNRAGIDSTTSRARWSLRARARRHFAHGVRASHVTFYQPSVATLEEYSIRSTTSVAVDLTSAVALTATLEDTYDSEARPRGARSNNDGQLVFGVRLAF